MSEINLIITKKEDLKSLLLEWLEEHSKQKQASEIKTLSKPMSRTELAEYLSISKVTVTDWMKKGMPHRRMNGRVYFFKEEVMESMKTFKRRKKNMMDS
jgi:transcriptional antiterminator